MMGVWTILSQAASEVSVRRIIIVNMPTNFFVFAVFFDLQYMTQIICAFEGFSILIFFINNRLERSIIYSVRQQLV